MLVSIAQSLLYSWSFNGAKQIIYFTIFRMDTSDYMANSDGKAAYFSAQIGTDPGKQSRQNAAAKGSAERYYHFLVGTVYILMY